MFMHDAWALNTHINMKTPKGHKGRRKQSISEYPLKNS